MNTAGGTSSIKPLADSAPENNRPSKIEKKFST